MLFFITVSVGKDYANLLCLITQRESKMCGLFSLHLSFSLV